MASAFAINAFASASPRGRERSSVMPAVGGRLLRARETDAVRALDRLDLDDIGAEDGEEVAHERARPEHREVEHAKPGERQGAAVAG